MKAMIDDRVRQKLVNIAQSLEQIYTDGIPPKQPDRLMEG
jgi:hypothetical protein